MKNKIPKEIKIFHQEYKIKFNNTFCDKKGVLGATDLNTQEITLTRQYDDKDLPQDRIFRTLCHEIAHIMLWEIAEEKLCYNEKFTDILGGSICSFLSQNCKWK